MDTDHTNGATSTEPAASAEPGGHGNSQAECPLSIRQQNWNLARFATHMGLIYLAAPVVYVGSLDAILLNTLGYSDTVANLPAAAYTWTTAPILVLFTWYFCSVRMLKPVLIVSYATSVVAGVFVVLGLLAPHSHWLVAALAVHATLTGWAMGIANIYEWEILVRGVAETRRGLALGLAFGLGPLMAVLSSLGTQLVLDAKLGPFTLDRFTFPNEFVTLFAASVVIMAIPAISAIFYTIPAPAVDIRREPLWSGVFGGLGKFLKSRLLMMTTMAFLVVVLGHDTILPNVTLFTRGSPRRGAPEISWLPVQSAVLLQSRGGAPARLAARENASQGRPHCHHRPLPVRPDLGH